MTDSAEPGELWTLGQALVWITCTTGDFASPTERDDLIASSGAPTVGERELLPLTLFGACRRWEKVKNDFEVEPSQFRNKTGEMLSLRFCGKKFNSAWDAAMSSLNAEVNRGQIGLFGLSAFTSSFLERVDRLECASLVLGQDFKCTIAKRAYSHQETRWKSLRFDAAQITTRWPANRPESRETARNGRPPAADWAAYEDEVNREIDAVGLPRKNGVPGWRGLSDVINFVEKKLQDDETPGKTALKENVGAMLRRRREREAGK
jgi:hypothetical protein